ncbi:MAG: porin [Planctomycetes bacterium]|nr:porin [Planctomycetota bacterium]
MTIKKQLVPVVLITGLFARLASAEDPNSLLSMPLFLLPNAQADDFALTSFEEPPSEDSAQADVAAPDESCAPGCESCGNAPPKPWSLPQPCLLQNLGIKTGGWLEQGITFNGNGQDGGFNGPVATNDLDGEYQMNQMWLYFTRPADNGGCGWALGGHVDMMYGTDWRFGINHGLEDRINGFDRQTYGLVIPQAYVEVAVNDLSVKIGHFAAILDYEVVPAIMNPFYSHSYSYGYTVPQLVTGVLTDYKLDSQWSIQSGFTRGWSMFEDYNDDLDFMGGVKWKSLDDQTSLAYALSTGAQDPDGENNRFVYSFVAKQKVTKKLQYVLVHNLGNEDDALPNAGGDGEWYGINQYFLYTINPCWQANLRAEWLRDDDGARVAGPGNIPGVRAWDGRGFAGDFYEVTAGLNWRPRPNVIVRPEIRWDWYDGLAGPTGLPFDNGQSDDQFLFATDLILTF